MEQRRRISRLVSNAQIVLESPSIESAPCFPRSDELRHSVNARGEAGWWHFDGEVPVAHEKIVLGHFARDAACGCDRDTAVLRNRCGWRYEQRHRDKSKKDAH
jgi:hypothetical protein